MKPLTPRSLVRAVALAAGLLLAAAPASAQLGNIFNKIQIPIPGVGSIGGSQASAPTPGSGIGEVLQVLVESPDRMDEGKEVQVGREMIAVLLGSKPLDPDMRLQRYVNRLGRWIALQSARPNLPWTFGVLDDPGFNAFAAPGGYILVTRGLVDRVDEAELAGILAHEITHVTEKHHLTALRNKAMQSGVLSEVGSRLTQNFARNSGVGGALANQLGGQLTSMVKDVFAKGLDREDEFQSDREGVALAARAGFDPYGLPAVLQGLRAASASDQNFSLLFSTHPQPQDRLDQLELAMGNRLDAYAGKRSVPLAQRLR